MICKIYKNEIDFSKITLVVSIHSKVKRNFLERPYPNE